MIKQPISQVVSARKNGRINGTTEGKFPIVQTLLGVDAAANDNVLALTALADGVVTEVTAGITNPDVYRSLSMVAAKTGVTPVAGNVTIRGKDWQGYVLEETQALNDTTPVLFNEPFASVDKITLPAWTNDVNDEISIGVSDKLGLYRSISAVGDVVQLHRSASAATSYTIEGTGPTINASHGTFLPNGGITANDKFQVHYLIEEL